MLWVSFLFQQFLLMDYRRTLISLGFFQNKNLKEIFVRIALLLMQRVTASYKYIG